MTMKVGGPHSDVEVAARWSIGLLDVFRLEQSGEVVEKFYGRKQDKLLAFLSLYRRRPHRRAELAQVLWPGKADGLARNRLAEVLYHLKKQSEEHGIAEIVVASRFTLQLNPHVATDIVRFENLIATGMEAGERAVRTTSIEEAVGLYGAGLLPLGVANDHLEVAAPLLVAQRRVEQGRGEALDRGQRSSQLV